MTNSFDCRRFKSKSSTFNHLLYFLIVTVGRLVVSVQRVISCFTQNRLVFSFAHSDFRVSENRVLKFEQPGRSTETPVPPVRLWKSVVMVPMSRNGSERRSIVSRFFTGLIDIAVLEAIVLALIEVVVLYLYRDYTISLLAWNDELMVS